MATTVTLNDNALLTITEAENFAWDTPDNHTDTEKDILYAFVNGISNAIEIYLGRKVINQEVTEYYDGGTETISLKNYPIISIDSVYEDGDELTVETNHGEDDEDYDYYEETGVIYRTGQSKFESGRQIVKATYTAGLGADTTEIPEDIKTAAKIWIKQVFKSDVENFGTIITEGSTIRPSNMPSLARLLLIPYAKRNV